MPGGVAEVIDHRQVNRNQQLHREELLPEQVVDAIRLLWL